VSGSEKRRRAFLAPGQRSASTAAPAGLILRDVEEGERGRSVGAFFDFDNTLIAGFSAVAFLGGWILSGRMGPSGLARTLLATMRFRAGQIGFSALVAETAEFLNGFRETEYRELADRIFSSWLAGDVFPEARALVRAHQRRGHTVAIVSSATRYQIEAIAHDLDIEHILCTELEVRDGCFTGGVVHPTCFREGKATAAERFAKALGVDLAKSYFYTDSHDDLALLNVVGRPRPTNPDRRLAAVAVKRGWPVRQFASRGLPGIEELLRTTLTAASLGPALALGIPSAWLDGDWREAVNLGQTTWGEVGTALAGVKVQIEGEQHLWSNRPAVFVFNHQSAIDTLLLCRVLRRDFVGVGKKEIASYPLLGRLFRYVGTVFVDRGSTSSAIHALDAAVDALREGFSVAIAPEGTRSNTARLGRFKKGAFHLAMRAKVPVVPIVFVNALDALPRQGYVIRRATVRVVVHPPIETSGWTPDSLDAHAAEVRDMFLDTLDEHHEAT
jgi:putative phosphoserine phosphatase/1-acylglycerol-3-phosphate O-acyltransferase